MTAARRIALGVAGIAVLVIGLWTPVAGLVPTDELVDALGYDLLVVGVVAVVAAVVAVPVFVAARAANVVETEMPDPEDRVTVPHAGASFDERLEAWLTLVPIAGSARREGIRTRLREAATRSIARTHQVDRERARELLETGEWTDDERVARFLRSDAGPSPTERLGVVLEGDSWFRRSARATVRELDLQRRDQYRGGAGE